MQYYYIIKCIIIIIIIIINNNNNDNIIIISLQVRGTGGPGFDPGPRQTKVVKNGTSCSSLGTQIFGVELGLVDPVSG